MQLPDNLDYPVPDPTWDYCPEYNQAISLARKWKDFWQYLSDQEEATPKSQAELKRKLSAIANELAKLQEYF